MLKIKKTPRCNTEECCKNNDSKSATPYRTEHRCKKEVAVFETSFILLRSRNVVFDIIPTSEEKEREREAGYLSSISIRKFYQRLVYSGAEYRVMIDSEETGLTAAFFLTFCFGCRFRLCAECIATRYANGHPSKLHILRSANEKLKHF